MTVWKFEKRAGMILDQQDDPGIGFDMKIAEFWPQDMDLPDIGVELEDNLCIADLSDGHTKVARYAIDTPSNTLASAMYFIAYGQDCIEKQAHTTIATGIKNAMVAHGVSIPEGFIEHIKTASYEDEVYADGGQCLPVTTAQQTAESVVVFDKNASSWRADDRMVIASKLQRSADIHGLDIMVKHSSRELSKTASRTIDRRIEVMKPLDTHPGRERYLDAMMDIKRRLSRMQDYREMLKCAHDLEVADIDAGMSSQWGGYFPDPVDSILTPMYGGDHPLDSIDKVAGPDLSRVNFDGLRGKFSDDIVDAIAEDPDSVIPTLPTAQKNIVTQYIKEAQS